MTVYEVTCEQSFSVCSRCELPCGRRDVIHLGRGAEVYLNMKLPVVLGLQHLEKATLYLFKLPVQQGFARSQSRFTAGALLDFYSYYGYAYEKPRVHPTLRNNFFDDPNRCVVEIDITSIAKAWLKGDLENYGLRLTGEQGSHRIVCASHLYEDAYLRPMLRLFTEDVMILQPLSAADCVVKAL